MTLRFLCRVLLAALGLASLFSLPAWAQDASRDQKVSDLERQIKALAQQLNKLKKGSSAASANQGQPTLPAEWARALHWRCIGPANMGGRIVALSVYEADPTIWWVATASGGLLKTTNNGISFVHQFDHEATVSIGDVCVAPSDPNIVWVGTGEHNPRNSVSYGDGVYKSADGGKTWNHMGLRQSFQTGRIVVHPKNPDIVYVGALGRLYGPNEERGLYKTTDGGVTWKKILHVDQHTGVIELRMHPTDPETLLVATWERLRDGFDSHAGIDASSGNPKADPPMPDGHNSYDPIKKWGPGSGIYKTTDGGRYFRKITQGLPTCAMGRIGLDYSRSNPNIVYAIVDSEKTGMGPFLQGSDAPDNKGARVSQASSNSSAGRAKLKVGDVITAVDKKPVKNFKELTQLLAEAKSGTKLALTVERGKETLTLTLTVQQRTVDGRRFYEGLMMTQRPNVQDKQGPNGHEYGGVYRSSDGGETWKRVNSFNPRPMYFSQIRVDPKDDNRVYVLGFEVYCSTDSGKTFRFYGGNVHGDQHALWIDPRDSRHMILGDDGGFYVTYDRGGRWDFINNMAIGQFYHVCIDARQPYRVYGGLQDNGSWGGPSRVRSNGGPTNADWHVVGSGDGFVCQVDPHDPDVIYCESQDGNIMRNNIRTGRGISIRPRNQAKERYRFNWNTPFIISRHNPGILYCAGNVVFRSIKKGDGFRAISPNLTSNGKSSATALSESPRNLDVLWAGTDDGNLWVTRDGGIKWTNVTSKVGLPKPFWVASIEASRFADGRAYVAFDAHRSDNDDPHVYMTDDFGETWKSLRGNLPVGSSRVCREDLFNADVLYLGTEFAVWASIDRGQSWTKINNNLPTVAVHELAQHPTAGEMVAATHGRSLWILDVTPLRQMKEKTVKAAATLFQPNTLIHWRNDPLRGGSSFLSGERIFRGENPPPGAQIYYALTKKAKAVTLTVEDITGKTLAKLPVKKEPGLHRVVSYGAAKAGSYRVVLTVDGAKHIRSLTIENDPTVARPTLIADEE